VLNDRHAGVTKFCLALEQLRRTDAGRVRTAKEMLEFFLPRDEGGKVTEDRVFVHIPPGVRGTIIAGWKIRGPKSAVRDGDEKVRLVLQDALLAGDLDEAMFETGIDPATLIDWVPLNMWWTFWRSGKLTGFAVQRALATARELGLFDDRWFLLNVDGRAGKLKGTDTICDTLPKDQIVAWLRKVHESGDGTPAGIVTALGWETILAKTSQEALLFAIDALAKKLMLDGGSASATEMPGRDDNVAVPDIPGFAPVSSSQAPATWSDVPSTEPAHESEPPSIRLIEEPAKVSQPPPLPPRKKA
jgi:hypothetical protein